MNILIVGGGGREHAIAWKVAQSTVVKKIYVAPGNAGTQDEPKTENIAIDASDINQLLNFALNKQIDLTIIGPEVPLVAGIVDIFTEHDLLCFGPNAKAAQLEGSKAFTKDFLARHAIPTAAYAQFTAHQQETAIDYVKNYFLSHINSPVVIKADGLAAGKGVVITSNESEAIEVIKSMFSGQFGQASKQIVIEEFISGEEASFIVLIDGKHVLPLATSQDHKARDNGDKGPNTGGMGAYSPAPVVTDLLFEKIMNTIITPTIAGLNKDKISYKGFLYVGVMIDQRGTPKVLEFNCRLGDPETQPLLFRLKSDLVELCLATLEERLDQVEAIWSDQVALGVVLASKGYPDSYPKNDIIFGLENCTNNDAVKVFHAGTKSHNGHVLSNGGRVLCCTALGNTAQEAQTLAYQTVAKIHWEHAYYRTDIGYRAITRKTDE